MNNRAVEQIDIQKLEHDATYVVLVTVCWVMTYIVTKIDQEHVGCAQLLLLRHGTFVYVAISALVVNRLIFFYARVLRQIWLDTFTVYMKIQIRPCHLQTSASNYTSE